MRRSDAALEASYFDRLLKLEGEFNPFAESGWGTIRRCFEEFVEPKDGLRILDIGCGTGQSRQLYIHRAVEYTGVDLSSGALELARKKFPRDNWFCCDARELPFSDESFDLVTYSSVLHHIADFESALREGLRVLKPGARSFAFDPNLLHPAMALFRYPKSPLYSAKGVSPNEAPLLPTRLRSAFESAGFTTSAACAVGYCLS